MSLRAGDWVEVRSKQEILASLDEEGRLDGLPFMPEMFEFCGRRFPVAKRAHKTCDTVTRTGGRRLADAVHLDLRCSGKAHGGCQAACLIFWKDAWLKRVVAKADFQPPSTNVDPEIEVGPARHSCTEDDIWRSAQAGDPLAPGETRFVCQATELPRYTERLRWWDARQYAEDYISGNVSILRLLRGGFYAGFDILSRAVNARWRAGLIWLYDRFQWVIGGVPYPRRIGSMASGNLAPISTLELQPGELVRVKSYEEILATLDTKNKNRGLFFDAELVPYCGGKYRVRTRISQFIDEETGRMSTLKTPAIILENVWCRSQFSSCRMFCPRAIYSWWREAWLERIP